MIPNRERKPKHASFFKFALNADFSLVRFHGQSAKGEAEAGGVSMFAAAVCLSEFFEDVFVLIRRDALAVVAHRDRHIRHVALNIYPDGSI